MVTHTWLEEHDSLKLSERLKGPWGDWECPCGNDRYAGQTRAAHARAHLDWAEGLRPTERQQLLMLCSDAQADTMLRVRQDSPTPLRRLAYDMANVFRRSQGYDFPMLPSPPHSWGDSPVGYLAMFREIAIALVVLHNVSRWGYWGRADSEGTIHFDQQTPTRAIAGVFVCGNYRRRGVGAALIRSACEREGLVVTDVPWGMPFSDAGVALAQSLVSEEQLKVC